MFTPSITTHAATVSLVIETTGRPGQLRSSLINNTFSTTSKLFTPNKHCWSHKHSSPYTGCISEWM